jgi:uncharacterized integral membrane protein
MTRLFPTILLTILFVSFALSNARRVALNFVFGETEVPLIVLLLASFTGGALTIFVLSMMKAAERRALERKVRVEMNRTALQLEAE